MIRHDEGLLRRGAFVRWAYLESKGQGSGMPEFECVVVWLTKRRIAIWCPRMDVQRPDGHWRLGLRYVSRQWLTFSSELCFAKQHGKGLIALAVERIEQPRPPEENPQAGEDVLRAQLEVMVR